MPDTETSFAKIFTSTQQRGMVLFGAILIAWTGVNLLRKDVYVSDPPPPRGNRADELLDRIDPNTADAAILAALPALGQRRAEDIVTFREKVKTAIPNRVVFEKPQDLMQVKGIGVAIVEQVRPFLRFGESATRPAEMSK